MTVDGTGKTLCITGAGGFLGCHVAKAALAAGFKVRGTCRSVEKLKPGVKSALEGVEWCEADLMAGSEGFEKAFEGCEFVLHTASPFFLEAEDAQKELIDPMLKGYDTVWSAAIKAGIKKMVYTSSTACLTSGMVPSGYNELCGGGKITEGRWNIMSEAAQEPYEYGKTMAERHAWATYFRRNRDTDPELVVLNPGLMIGPPVAPETASSSTSVKLIIGAYVGAFTSAENTPPIRIPPSDVRQVAQAHVDALAPHTKGRYILCHEKSMDVSELFATIADDFPDNKFPKEVAPISDPMEFDNSRTLKDLEIELYPVSKTMKDAIGGLKAFGIVE